MHLYLPQKGLEVSILHVTVA